jgi:hypothetical protein
LIKNYDDFSGADGGKIRALPLGAHFFTTNKRKLLVIKFAANRMLTANRLAVASRSAAFPWQGVGDTEMDNLIFPGLVSVEMPVGLTHLDSHE